MNPKIIEILPKKIFEPDNCPLQIKGYNKALDEVTEALKKNEVCVCPSEEEILKQFSTLPNYEDAIGDEVWNQIKFAVDNNNKEMLSKIFQISVKLTHIECAEAIRKLILAGLGDEK